MKCVLGFLLLLYLPGPVTAGELNPYHGFDEAPALSLQDLGHRVHSLAEYRGRVVLVNFWASWCGPCVIEMPSMQRLQKAMTGKPFSILAVNVAESRVKVWNFAAKLGIEFPLLLDRDGQAASDWQVDVYPSSFLLDRQGRIQYVAYGARKWDGAEMIRTIDGLLGKSQTVTPQAE
ncbi:MAG: TlpA family protein disulfide reductase [Thiogranum sp.]|jgi:thiol-disulfide isomerase/thioredoxin|nr:TlpA family protein disulfide reductase [Thiogranum sp.]